MTINDNHIMANTGKVFRRISDGLVYGNEIYLGYTYYINEEKLDTPHLEVPEDFEEIDDMSEITAEEALQIITGQDEKE